MRPAQRLLALVTLAAMVAAGCLNAAPGAIDASGGDGLPGAGAAGAALSFAAPVDFHALGYEPGVAVDSAGTLYVTAHKQNIVIEGTRLASWLWVSHDGGATWSDLPSPGGAHTMMWAAEGDIAIDAQDRMYYVDTMLADNTISAWSDHGKAWDYSRPIQGTTTVDDRPWLAAQGEGVVHYVGNNGAALLGSRMWYYRSTDGGVTWTPGTPLPSTGGVDWTHIEAERGGDHAYIVQDTDGYGDSDIRVFASGDQGASWGEPVTVGERRGPAVQGFPVVAVDAAGVVYVAWGEYAEPNDPGSATRILLGRSLDHGATWEVFDVTPFEGSHQFPWVSAGPEGTVGLSFYGTRDVPVTDESAWHVYGGVATGAHEGAPAFEVAKADAEPVLVGANYGSLGHFFENAVGPDGRLHIAYQQNGPDGRWVRFVTQSEGANLLADAVGGVTGAGQ